MRPFKQRRLEPIIKVREEEEFQGEELRNGIKKVKWER